MNLSKYHDFIRSFLKDTGLPDKGFKIHSIAGDGSIRLFRRIIISNSFPSFIFMENMPSNTYQEKENLAYLMIGGHLHKKGLPVPEIYRSDLNKGWFILEDLGDINLQDMSKGDNRLLLYENVLETLFGLQTEGKKDFNTKYCCQTRVYDEYVMRRYESDYFRDAFLSNYLEIEKDLSDLDGPFNHLSSTASKADNSYFLHRDFQSRNIMITNGRPGILDWQGARLGPLSYDLASLLIDPYANLSRAEKETLYNQYVLFLKKHENMRVASFEKYFPYLSIQRNLQILGAFSFLTKIRGKIYFEDYIPPALMSLRVQLDELADTKLSSLKDVVDSIDL